MTHILTPLREGVIDAATGRPMPMKGVLRDVLLPPDHHQERTGDIAIQSGAEAPEPTSSTDEPTQEDAE